MSLTRRELAALALAAAAAPWAACGENDWHDIAAVEDLIEGQFVRVTAPSSIPADGLRADRPGSRSSAGRRA